MDDFRQTLRSLRRQPGFVAVAVLTLAFGIGVNATLFSMISVVFLEPLPVRDPEALVLLMQRGGAMNMPRGLSYQDYREYRDTATSLSDLAAYMPMPVHVAARAQTERTWIEVVSPNYFALAGVSPAFGAFPRPDEEANTGAPSSAVLSHSYWQRRFGADPGIVGQTIKINGKDFTVIAIAPESFTGLSWAMAVSAFVPAGGTKDLMENGAALLENRRARSWRLMGRLATGRTIDDARAEVEVIAARLAAAYPAEHEGARVVVMPENRSRPDPAIAGFLPIFAVVFAALGALVLLIACANVANLMIGRWVERSRELVIRSALGAGRLRLVRLIMIESLVLAAMGAAAGVLLAEWAGTAIAAFTPTGDIPVNEHHGPEWRIWLFTFAVSAAAGVVTGAWPALKATRFSLIEALKEGAGTVAGGRHRLRNALIIGQVAMSLVVLVAGGLFLQSLRQLKNQELGFNPAGLVMMSIDLGSQQYSEERGYRFLEELLSRATALPGVTSATAISHVPFDIGPQFLDVTPDREIPGSKDNSLSVAYSAVAPRFFETLETSIVLGRALDVHDDARSRRVAVVNETLARMLWPGEDPVGRRFRIGRERDWIQVAGVARDGRYVTLAEQSRPYFYLPLAQHYRTPIHVLVRAETDAPALAGPLQRLVQDLDGALPAYNGRTMTHHMRDSVFGLMPVRFGAAMAAVQGAIALLLAVMGLYAVVSYTVARRVREIGVRLALGATTGDVLRLVVRDGMRLALVGTGLGWLIAAGLGVVLSGVLHGLAPFDLAVFGGVTVLLAGISAAACYTPARKAMRVDPLACLRAE